LGLNDRYPHICIAASTQKSTHNKKNPANAKGNTQQRCMFESPVKQNLSSPVLAMMFLLQSPEGARRPAVNYLQCFTCTRHRARPVSLSQRRIG